MNGETASDAVAVRQKPQTEWRWYAKVSKLERTKKKCPGLLKDTRHNKCIYYSEPHIITRPFLLGTAFVWSKIIFHILFTFCHVVVMYGDVDGTIPSTKLTVDFCILSKWWCACFFIAMLIFLWFFFNSNQLQVDWSVFHLNFCSAVLRITPHHVICLHVQSNKNKVIIKLNFQINEFESITY